MTQVANAEPAPPTRPRLRRTSRPRPVTRCSWSATCPRPGVQIYTCNGTDWVLSSVPRADLVDDDNGKLIIKHFAGPTWQEAPDGSSVVAKKLKDGVTIPTTSCAIPWLLLKATKTTAGRGGHLLSHTTFIQRVNTTGGLLPPPADCTASKRARSRRLTTPPTTTSTRRSGLIGRIYLSNGRSRTIWERPFPSCTS